MNYNMNKKGKLRKIYAVLLACLMVLTSLTMPQGKMVAYAAAPTGDDISEATCSLHNGVGHFYSLGSKYDGGAGERVKGYFYASSGYIEKYDESTGGSGYAPSNFESGYEEGWYYQYDSTNPKAFRKCTGTHGHTHTYTPAWSSNATKHWHESTCGHDVKGSEGGHEPGAPATVDAAQTCTTCGYVIAPKLLVSNEITFDKVITSAGGTLTGNYYLADDVTLTSNITISGTVNIDLNGHVLKGTNNIITVGSGATLNLYDSNTTTGHKGNLSNDGYFWTWDGGANTGDTVINGGIITGGKGNDKENFGPILVNGSGTFNMHGGTIAGCGASSASVDSRASAVLVDGSSAHFNMFGGTIEYCYANSRGGDSNPRAGAVFVEKSNFDMTGGTIRYCASISTATNGAQGGGIIGHNSSSNAYPKITIDGENAVIENCKSAQGAGIEMIYGTLNFKNGIIQNNISTDVGGGIGLGNPATINISGGLIQGNTAAKSSAGIRLRNGTLNMTGGKIINNTVTDAVNGFAGGIDCSNTSLTAANINIGGTAVITGNKVGEQENNVYLGDGKYITLKEPSSTMQVGVTTKTTPTAGNPVKFVSANGNTTNYKYFVADRTAEFVAFCNGSKDYATDDSEIVGCHSSHPNGSVWLATHVHDWKYTVGTGDDANKITAKCEGYGDCTVVNGKTDGATIALTVSDADYTGLVIGATGITGLSDFNTKTGNSITLSSVKYWTDASHTVPTSTANAGASGDNAAPVKAGTYYATLEVGGVTTVVSYTISKIDTVSGVLAYTAPISTDYDGNAKTVTVTAQTGVTGLGAITVKYYNSLNEEVSAPTNAGTYKVMVTVAEGDNYNAVTTPIELATFTIDKVDYSGTKAAFGNLPPRTGYTVDITLPSLPDGASYGTVVNSNTEFFTVGTISDGKVTVTSAKDWDDDTESTPRTFTIPVTGATNYYNYDVTVTVTPTFHVHEVGTHHEAVAGTCTTKGTIEYYDCAGTIAGACGKYLDADGNELASIEGEIVPSGHTYGTTGDARFTCTECLTENSTKKAEAELADAKEAAYAAIDEAVGTDTSENVAEAAADAKAAIGEATTVDAVTTAKIAGVAAIAAAKGENSLAAAIRAAKAAIIEEVGSDTSENVVEAAEEAMASIDAAETIEAVTEAKEAGIEAIRAAKAANALAKAKADAKAAIDAEVDGDTTPAVVAAAAAAKAAIDAAETIEAVTEAKEAGIAAVEAAKGESSSEPTEPEPTEPEPEKPAPAPDMTTTNIGGLAYDTWEDIVENTPKLTVEKLHEVNFDNQDLLHVNIYGKVDKLIPVEAIESLKKSPIKGLHVFVGEGDAVTFLNDLDYSNYTTISFKHEDVIEENRRVIDFTTKGKINATVMFHTLIAPNVNAKVYKVIDGKEVEIATLSSNADGGFCFLIDELSTYVIKY